jgi:radical SAM/Cys-rich protein
MHATLPLLEHSDFPQLSRGKLETLQVNLGYLCNQQCQHCHVNAGPKRQEIMSLDVINSIINLLESGQIKTLDLTGGAPEMHPHFRYLVTRSRALGVHVIDRCNLTILNEPGHEDLAEFLAQHKVEVTASLPCYSAANVDKQRGKGIFESSIKGLQQLNRLGYARADSTLILNLVYNPQGPALPPNQQQLELDYKQQLLENHGITFNQLFTITNMPINRFGSMLISTGQFEPYMQLLRATYQADNLENVMCRTLISLDWQGYVYDCDFNQMLGLPLKIEGKNRQHISGLLNKNLEGQPIVVRDHCYGCTAGQGSSCGGTLT